MTRTWTAAAACLLLGATAATAQTTPGNAANPQQDLVAAPTPGTPTSPGSAITYGGEIETKLQVDGTWTRGQRGIAELYAKSVGTAYVNLGDNLSVRGEYTYERFRAQSASTAFNSEGLYLSQLYATYAMGPVTLYGGKIHPRFSVGYDRVPGIYDTFANDYEQKERIGVGALISLVPAWGRHVLSAETYFLDTSILSRSLLSYPAGDDPAALRPGRFRRIYGGAGNTGRFDSFDIALDGSRIPGFEQFRYHLGYSRQGTAQPDETPETGLTAAISYEFKLTPRIAMTPFVEYAHFDNFGGNPGERRDYLVSALEFDYRKYALSLVAAPRRVQQEGAKARYDVQYSATLTYTIMPRLDISAGYLRTRDDTVVTNTLGTAVTYTLRF